MKRHAVLLVTGLLAGGAVFYIADRYTKSGPLSGISSPTPMRPSGNSPGSHTPPGSPLARLEVERSEPPELPSRVPEAPPEKQTSDYSEELNLLAPEWVEKLRAVDSVLEYVRVLRWLPRDRRPIRAAAIASALCAAKEHWLAKRPVYDAQGLATRSPALLAEFEAASSKALAEFVTERFELLSTVLPEFPASELEAKLGR